MADTSACICIFMLCRTRHDASPSAQSALHDIDVARQQVAALEAHRGHAQELLRSARVTLTIAEEHARHSDQGLKEKQAELAQLEHDFQASRYDAMPSMLADCLDDMRCFIVL